MSYKDTDRYQLAVAAFLDAAARDVQLVDDAPQAKRTIELASTSHDEAAEPVQSGKTPYSLVYHRRLVYYVQELCPEPSEALTLASYCQHIRRWEIPRSSYPEGLAGYKAWRIRLNKFHTACAHEILVESGYSQEDAADGEIFARIADLLQKKTLKGGNDRGEEEMQVFEDAICLTFMHLEFAEFARKHDPDKMVKIVQKTWKKMGKKGRDYAVENLAAGLPDDAKEILMQALAEA